MTKKKKILVHEIKIFFFYIYITWSSFKWISWGRRGADLKRKTSRCAGGAPGKPARGARDAARGAGKPRPCLRLASKRGHEAGLVAGLPFLLVRSPGEPLVPPRASRCSLRPPPHFGSPLGTLPTQNEGTDREGEAAKRDGMRPPSRWRLLPAPPCKQGSGETWLQPHIPHSAPGQGQKMLSLLPSLLRPSSSSLLQVGVMEGEGNA